MVTQRVTVTGQGPLGGFPTTVVAVTLLWWDICPETLPAACRHRTQALHESTTAASFLQTQTPPGTALRRGHGSAAISSACAAAAPVPRQHRAAPGTLTAHCRAKCSEQQGLSPQKLQQFAMGGSWGEDAPRCRGEVGSPQPFHRRRLNQGRWRGFLLSVLFGFVSVLLFLPARNPKSSAGLERRCL